MMCKMKLAPDSCQLSESQVDLPPCFHLIKREFFSSLQFVMNIAWSSAPMGNLRQNSRGLTWETQRVREKVGWGVGVKKESSSPSSSTSPFFSEVRAGLLPRNRPTLDLSLSITNLPNTSALVARRAAKLFCLIELDGFHTATECRKCLWGVICVVYCWWCFLSLCEVPFVS